MRHVCEMCRSRLCDLYWVSTTICRSPELIRFEIAKSIRRYCPPNGTAGLARSAVRGIRRLPSPPARMIPKTFGAAGMAPHYDRTSGPCTSVRDMRVDIITKEYPPEIYGGAGVHVTELVKALRELDGRAGARVRRSRATRTGTTAYGVPAELVDANARDPDPRHRSRDRDGCRGRRRRAQPHLVRELRRAPRVAAARHPAHRDGAQPRAAAAVEGRAARRRLRRVELDREDGVRGRGRDRRGERRACAPTSCAAIPSLDPGEGARHLQRHRRRGVAPGRGSGAARGSSASTRPSRPSSSSGGSRARRACRTCCAPPSSCRPTCS